MRVLVGVQKVLNFNLLICVQAHERYRGTSKQVADSIRSLTTIIKMPKLAASGTTALCLANVPQQTPESHARPFRR